MRRRQHEISHRTCRNLCPAGKQSLRRGHSSTGPRIKVAYHERHVCEICLEVKDRPGKANFNYFILVGLNRQLGRTNTYQPQSEEWEEGPFSSRSHVSKTVPFQCYCHVLRPQTQSRCGPLPYRCAGGGGGSWGTAEIDEDLVVKGVWGCGPGGELKIPVLRAVG